MIVIDECDSIEKRDKHKFNATTKKSNIEELGKIDLEELAQVESTDQNIPDNPVIVDGINNPLAFHDSRLIKREIKKTQEHRG